MKSTPVGWRNESHRHSLSARGISTTSRGIQYVPSESSTFPYVTGVGNQRVKYLVGRIHETLDLVEHGDLTEDQMQDVIAYLINEIRESSLYMSVTARGDDEWKNKLENIIFALDEYIETGCMNGMLPSDKKVIEYLIALSYVFKKAMGVG